MVWKTQKSIYSEVGDLAQCPDSVPNFEVIEHVFTLICSTWNRNPHPLCRYGYRHLTIPHIENEW